tara:strand:+ start:396 stop:833 length:438 start_codon:yes stop_codon:yes gene_type:complete
MGSGAHGPSQRQLRVGEVIRQRFAEVLARDDLEAEILKKTSITVTEVRITPDLRQASVYVMPLGGMHLSEIVDKLNVEAPRLKKAALGGLHLKYVPNIKFIADESFDRAASMDQLLDSRVVARDLGHPETGSNANPDASSEAGKS